REREMQVLPLSPRLPAFPSSDGQPGRAGAGRRLLRHASEEEPACADSRAAAAGRVERGGLVSPDRPAPPLSDDAARRRAVTDFEGNLVVLAGAGTGKTALLVERA